MLREWALIAQKTTPRSGRFFLYSSNMDSINARFAAFWPPHDWPGTMEFASIVATTNASSFSYSGFEPGTTTHKFRNVSFFHFVGCASTCAVAEPFINVSRKYLPSSMPTRKRGRRTSVPVTFAVASL